MNDVKEMFRDLKTLLMVRRGSMLNLKIDDNNECRILVPPREYGVWGILNVYGKDHEEEMVKGFADFMGYQPFCKYKRKFDPGYHQIRALLIGVLSHAEYYEDQWKYRLDDANADVIYRWDYDNPGRELERLKKDNNVIDLVGLLNKEVDK